jgi:hypothetical protein
MENDWARPLVHFEIEAKDAQRQRTFYGEMFNWNIGDGAIMSFDPGLGAPQAGAAGHIRQSDRSGITLYIQVRVPRRFRLADQYFLNALKCPTGQPWQRLLIPKGTLLRWFSSSRRPGLFGF